MKKEVLNKLLGRIELRDLNQDEALLSEILGMDAVKILVENDVNDLYIKKIYGFKRVIKDYIKEELDCKSQKQIARELGLSKNYMRKLLRELNCEEA